MSSREIVSTGSQIFDCNVPPGAGVVIGEEEYIGENVDRANQDEKRRLARQARAHTIGPLVWPARLARSFEGVSKCPFQ